MSKLIFKKKINKPNEELKVFAKQIVLSFKPKDKTK